MVIISIRKISTFYKFVTLVKVMKNENALVAEKLDGSLLKLEKFLRLNDLKLNIDKTELIRVTSSQQLSENGTESLCLAAKNSKNENIKSAISAKILGMTFQNNLKWSAHFEKGGEAVINKCKRKLGALKHVARDCLIEFRKKKKLADGCVMSRLTYGIQIWGLSINKHL